MSAPAPTERRRVVVLLGMHRSGTSVTMNVLNALGLPLSDDLMPATEFNAKGYFESFEISQIHDRILGSFGMLWSSSTITHPLPANWWRLPQIAPLKAALVEIVQREFAKAGSLWGFKDPRTARLLPLWLDIIQELDLDPKFILVTRHPTDVARSLYAREQVAPLQSELLWIEHNVDALVHTRGKLDAIVDYRQWFLDPIEPAVRLIDGIGLQRPDNLKEILSEIVSGDLEHHVSTDRAFTLPFCSELYDALLRRDSGTLGALTNFFQVTRNFSQVIVGGVTRELLGRIQSAEGIARDRAQRIAALENEVRSLQAMQLARSSGAVPGEVRAAPPASTQVE